MVSPPSGFQVESCEKVGTMGKPLVSQKQKQKKKNGKPPELNKAKAEG